MWNSKGIEVESMKGMSVAKMERSGKIKEVRTKHGMHKYGKEGKKRVEQ